MENKEDTDCIFSVVLLPLDADDPYCFFNCFKFTFRRVGVFLPIGDNYVYVCKYVQVQGGRVHIVRTCDHGSHKYTEMPH